MIHLQQYERLMKALVAHTELEGPLEQLKGNLDRQVVGTSTKTLGMLVGALTDSYLAQATSEGTADLEDTEADQKPSGQSWIKIAHQLVLSPKRYEETKQALSELVAMRNELVHHFLEHFALELEAGCKEANTYLDACYEQINGHYLELQCWTNAMEKSRKIMASLVQTPQFEDAIVHGIWPDGAVHWASSTIVECLRNAERDLAVDGWTQLDSAISSIRTSHPSHTPTKYGCRSWRQLLKKSGQFEIRTDTNPLNGRGHAWYRSHHERVIESS